MNGKKIAIVILLLFLVICLKDLDMQYYLVRNDYFFDVNLYFAFVDIFLIALLSLSDENGFKQNQNAHCDTANN